MDVDNSDIYCVEIQPKKKSNVCQKKDCKKRPTFNYEGLSAKYCSEHKEKNMIDVIHARCHEINCNKIPTFNYEGLPANYCFEHKEVSMIDVAHARCQEKNCNKIPNFNYDVMPAKYCFEHKEVDMIDVTHARCREKDCINRPTFNYEGLPAIYCSEHKKTNMIDVANKHCKTPLCYTIVQNKYAGYCLFCYIHLFPDKPVARNYKTKERAVAEFIQTTFPEYPWISDKLIQDGCSKRRPDLMVDLGYQVIIIEVDENQHRDYDCSCENKRIMQLSQDVGHRPIIFIRFNPDEYANQDKKITSCWGNNKNGICVVKKSKQKEWQDRLTTLSNQVRYWLDVNNKTNKTVEVVQLFYDI